MTLCLKRAGIQEILLCCITQFHVDSEPSPSSCIQLEQKQLYLLSACLRNGTKFLDLEWELDFRV